MKHTLTLGIPSYTDILQNPTRDFTIRIPKGQALAVVNAADVTQGRVEFESSKLNYDKQTHHLSLLASLGDELMVVVTPNDRIPTKTERLLQTHWFNVFVPGKYYDAITSNPDEEYRIFDTFGQHVATITADDINPGQILTFSSTMVLNNPNEFDMFIENIDGQKINLGFAHKRADFFRSRVYRVPVSKTIRDYLAKNNRHFFDLRTSDSNFSRYHGKDIASDGTVVIRVPEGSIAIKEKCIIVKEDGVETYCHSYHLNPEQRID